MAEQQDKEQVYEPGTYFYLFLIEYKKFHLGSYVELELKKFAERRTDIFGMGSQETTIGRKVRRIYYLIFQRNQFIILDW
jgi:hypothetical protein